MVAISPLSPKHRAQINALAATGLKASQIREQFHQETGFLLSLNTIYSAIKTEREKTSAMANAILYDKLTEQIDTDVGRLEWAKRALFADLQAAETTPERRAAFSAFAKALEVSFKFLGVGAQEAPQSEQADVQEALRLMLADKRIVEASFSEVETEVAHNGEVVQ